MCEFWTPEFWGHHTHLGQLLGVVFITGGLVALAWRLRSGRAGVWAMFGCVGSITTLRNKGTAYPFLHQLTP